MREDIDWGWFGSMKGSGDFKKAINNNHKDISNALDYIPNNGSISKEQFLKFVDKFQSIFNKKMIAPATRLLAMKRPDYFVCLDSKNRIGLCKDFGMPSSNMTYEIYWNQIILRIVEAEWWLNPHGIERLQQKIKPYRAAFLDAIYYDNE